MTLLFYVTGGIALAATVLFLRAVNAVHALLHVIVSLLAIALLFFMLGASFAAALEVIIYAGAIMVLFIFVVMMVNPGPAEVAQERRWLAPDVWLGPSVLAGILLAEVLFLIATGGVDPAHEPSAVGPREVGIQLLGPYLLAVELASMLLLPGILGAYHLGRRERDVP